MKNTSLILCLFLISGLVFGEKSYSLDSSIFKKQEFIEHMGRGPFQRSLQMNIEFSSIRKLFMELDKDLKGALNKRNARKEAHITVITPPEFDNILDGFISINEIHELARRSKIQDSKFNILCLGKSEASVRGKSESTYYLVVQSMGLNKLREQIRDLFITRGGDSRAFSAAEFYPHITIGYTYKDLHIGPHGVKKDLNSCFREIKL